MCGIAGIVGRPSPDLLDRMGARLAHRGPDGAGAVLRGSCGLAHRRLAVIDIVGGHQPMLSSDDRFVLVFNGEIYNYRRLREELEANGRSFSTDSDTEVLLVGYQHWGEAVLDRLEGMFAFAIWDTELETLWIARDRLGIKPLYYAYSRSGFAFASEIKALLCLPGQSAALDPVALDAYLDLLYVPPPLSMYEGISQLPPGHVLRWKASGVEVRRYWEPGGSPKVEMPLRDWVNRVENLLVDAVTQRLVADVPVGAFLSGGLDSATIVAIARARGHRALQTFSVGFGPEGRSFDESAAARAIASYLGTRHHEIRVDASVLDDLPAVVDAFDEPFGSPTALLSLALCRFAREHVTVALSGDGGDEVFGGYPRYRAMAYGRWLDALPTGVWHGVRKLWPAEDDRSARPWKRRIREFVEGMPLDEADRYAAWVGYRARAVRDALLSPAMRRALRGKSRVSPNALHYLHAPYHEAIDRACHADLHGFLPENVLRNSDRASMYHGLEVRVPYCDHRVVELMATAPARLRVPGVADKRVLRGIASRLLPPELLPRAKQGFNGPMAHWLGERLPRLLADHLHPEVVARRGLLCPEAVGRLVGEHRAEIRDHSTRLWSLVVVEEWLRCRGDDQTLVAAA